MPIEIKELIVRAVVGNSDQLSSGKKNKSASRDDSKENMQLAEALEQMKQMMLDHKER